MHYLFVRRVSLFSPIVFVPFMFEWRVKWFISKPVWYLLTFFISSFCLFFVIIILQRICLPLSESNVRYQIRILSISLHSLFSMQDLHYDMVFSDFESTWFHLLLNYKYISRVFIAFLVFLTFIMLWIANIINDWLLLFLFSLQLNNYSTLICFFFCFI